MKRTALAAALVMLTAPAGVSANPSTGGVTAVSSEFRVPAGRLLFNTPEPSLGTASRVSLGSTITIRARVIAPSDDPDREVTVTFYENTATSGTASWQALGSQTVFLPAGQSRYVDFTETVDGFVRGTEPNRNNQYGALITSPSSSTTPISVQVSELTEANLPTEVVMSGLNKTFTSASSLWKFFAQTGLTFPNAATKFEVYGGEYIGIAGTKTDLLCGLPIAKDNFCFGLWEQTTDLDNYGTNIFDINQVTGTLDDVSTPLANRALTPAFRVRNSGNGFGTSSELLVQSLGQNRATPDIDDKIYANLLPFRETLPSGTNRVFNHWDYLVLDGCDQPNGQLRLHRTRSWRFNISGYLHYWLHMRQNGGSGDFYAKSIGAFDSGDFGQWTSYKDATGNVTTTRTTDYLEVGSNSSTPQGGLNFGFWTSPPLAPIRSGRLYIAQITAARTSQPDVDDFIPTMRVRLHASSFEISSATTYADNRSTGGQAASLDGTPRQNLTAPSAHWALLYVPTHVGNIASSENVYVAVDYIQTTHDPTFFRVYDVKVWEAVPFGLEFLP